MSPAGLRHVWIVSWLDRVLGLYVSARGLGEVLGPDFAIRLSHLGISRRVPDLQFVSQANLVRLQANHLDGPPDLAIEVVSTDSVTRDVTDKFVEYQAAGVSECWTIDPATDTFNAYARDAVGRFVAIELDETGLLHSAVVPGFWINPAWLCYGRTYCQIR